MDELAEHPWVTKNIYQLKGDNVEQPTKMEVIK